MEGKRVKESTVLMAQLMTPEDANPAGNVHGGVIMKLIDNAGGAVAARHARSNVVTASIDRLSFHHPVHIGDLVTFKASVNAVGRTSMEVGVRVEAENLITGKVRHTASAYLTYVALGGDARPRDVPPLILESEDEERRFNEAKARTQMRRLEREREEGKRPAGDGMC
ncbi:MAG TPA: acyl-CoA thioesterase [Deltaproteobacteria bacterium]|jgi:uncharacterized protein (TIGR00369 family)|nr:acyl-CoA thioesterase [Deltaproteobacteria bacterium]HOI07881.1 acyl-CoA thioesterase [Deltaproteobacteria bacterium]